jgi:DNA mismatch repair protein MutL
MPIRQLAPDVAAKIAAGEVVERPASVVKELIENSIDAGATQIRVDLSHGGLQLIRVIDNGSGIPAEELPLALARHATSKVAQIDDLEHIRSLGFRGEALASIAAVADVTLVSRYRDAAQGAQIGANNGQVSEVTAAASPEGTTLTVRNLFSAVPARLKFLKGRNTEVSHCHHLLEQYALAYPEIRFSVFSEGRQIFSTSGDGQLFSVLVEMYGLQVAEQMIPVASNERPDDPEYPIISGYTSVPACYKSTRQHISFFVNRRWVLSRMLTTAVEGAYHSLLLTGRHPIAIVNIQIDPTQLDVNVHPAKTEIRFLKDRRMFAVILRAIRAALLGEPAMPEWKPDDDAVRAQLIAPSTPNNDDVSDNNDVPDEPEQRAFPQDNPWLTVAEEETGTKPPLLSRLWQSHIRPPDTETSVAGTDSIVEAGVADDGGGDSWAALDVDEKNDDPNGESRPYGEIIEPIQQQTRATQGSNVPAPPIPSTPAPTEQRSDSQQPLPHTSQMPIVGLGAHGRRLPRLRVVGQLSQSYIVTEGQDGMYLIDQHAAHERILLERMVAALQTRTPISQLLLTPIVLELAPIELEAIEEHQEQLTQIGFTLESGRNELSPYSVFVRAVPSVLVKQMNTRSLHELLVEMTASENLGHTETWEERALANVACKAAIKANYFLTVSEMREMLEQLEQTKAPYSCCHGRPTMIHFSLSALAHEFERR